jgi:hypothetical protein
MNKILRSAERCKLPAVFVALALEPPLLVFVPLAVDVLLLVVILPVLVAVVCPALALGVPRIPPWAVAGTLWPLALEAADLNASSVSEPLAKHRVTPSVQ